MTSENVFDVMPRRSSVPHTTAPAAKMPAVHQKPHDIAVHERLPDQRRAGMAGEDVHDGAVNKRKALAACAAVVGAIGLAAATGPAAFAGPARAADGPGTAACA